MVPHFLNHKHLIEPGLTDCDIWIDSAQILPPEFDMFSIVIYNGFM